MRVSPRLSWTVLTIPVSLFLVVWGWDIDLGQGPEWLVVPLTRIVLAAPGIIALYLGARDLLNGGGLLTSATRVQRVEIDGATPYTSEAIALGASEGLEIWLKAIVGPSKRIDIDTCLVQRHSHQAHALAGSVDKRIRLRDVPTRVRSFCLGGTGSPGAFAWTPAAFNCATLIPERGAGEYCLRLQVRCDVPGAVVLTVRFASTRVLRTVHAENSTRTREP